MANETKQLKEAVKELLNTATPEQWISYLFNLQNSLIANGHFEGYTRKGCREHANYFYGLKEFFETLNQN